MPSYNHVTLVGNLTRGVEVKYLPSGTAVAEIGLAVNERVKKGDHWQDESHFFDCVLWGKTAENAAQYLHKGSCVLVDGSLRYERWEKDGKVNSKVKVNVFKLQFLDSKKQEQHKPEPFATTGTTHFPPDDEAPF